MSRPKILIIENSLYVTGALKSIIRTSKDLSDDFDFVFVIPTHSKGKYLIESRGFTKIYELRMRELSRRIVAVIGYFPFLILNAIRLKRIITKENIQIIHNNDLYNLLPVALRLMGTSVPYICHVRFLPDKFPGWLFNSWIWLHLRYANQIICVSHHLKDKLPTHSKIDMIYNELPEESDRSKNIKKTNTLLYISNIIKGKGQEYAIEAFSQLSSIYPDWKLRFVGGDMGLSKNKSFKLSLIELANKKNLNDKIEWVDFTEQVEFEYKSAAITLNFSESESFSLTCVEAQAFGCPVVATRCGGPSEIINDGQTGFLVPIKDITAMVKAMRILMSDPKLRASFAEKAREMVQSKFSIKQTSARLKEFYCRSLIKR
jgi:glycosyltransferase involved in cell wall biosynthesis